MPSCKRGATSPSSLNTVKNKNKNKRWLGLLTSMYVNHMTVQELASARGCGQRSMLALFALTGRAFDQREAKDMAPPTRLLRPRTGPFRNLHDWLYRPLTPGLLANIFPAFEHALAGLPAASALPENRRNKGVLVCGENMERWADEANMLCANVRRCQTLPPQPPLATCSCPLH